MHLSSATRATCTSLPTLNGMSASPCHLECAIYSDCVRHHSCTSIRVGAKSANEHMASTRRGADGLEESSPNGTSPALPRSFPAFVAPHLALLKCDKHLAKKICRLVLCHLATMLSLSSLLLVSSALSSIAYAAGDGLIAAHRKEADEQTVNALAALRKRSTGELPTKLGKSLYWFGHFDVGEGHDYHLLLDTGSSDCILNNNLCVKIPIKLPNLALPWQH